MKKIYGYGTPCIIGKTKEKNGPRAYNLGGSDLFWTTTLLPRINYFLPSKTILEIAPGMGRWTKYLKQHCDHLIIVDLSPKCIEACRQRFSADNHISYYVNDGKSLDMIEDSSIDFVFSFDSLVHADITALEAYLNQVAAKLLRGIPDLNLALYGGLWNQDGQLRSYFRGAVRGRDFRWLTEGQRS